MSSPADRSTSVHRSAATSLRRRAPCTPRPTTELAGAGFVAACSRRSAAAQPPTSCRTSPPTAAGFVFEPGTVTTTMSSPADRSTSVHRSAATSLRRRAPWKTSATIAPSTKPRHNATSSRSTRRPVRRGRQQTARTRSHSSAVRPRAGLRRGAAAAARRRLSMACRVSGPSGWRVPASRASPRTAASTMAAVAGERPASRRVSRYAARFPSSSGRAASQASSRPRAAA